LLTLLIVRIINFFGLFDSKTILFHSILLIILILGSLSGYIANREYSKVNLSVINLGFILTCPEGTLLFLREIKTKIQLIFLRFMHIDALILND
jgi:hypothetical protein